MADNDYNELKEAPAGPSAPEAANPQMEGGAYEIIRNRLLTQGKDLAERLDKLNSARRDIFGGVEPKLIATDRITTQHNCVPRDMVEIGGDRFIFGYNVRLGLKTETNLSDVFSIYQYQDGTFHEESLDQLILNSDFEDDFKSLYKYYKDTQFAKFRIIGPALYMVFRTGKAVDDIKTFKWAITDDGIQYVGNRFDHEFHFPPQHEFEWVRTHRDHHQSGTYPHISIEDRVFVETLDGDLTIKVENNTESGEGIYTEPVDNKDQTLDDAEVYYASLGNLILIRVRPFQEQKFRYFVYNEKLKQVRRFDRIHDACVLLPDEHGIIFPNGYYLQGGAYKTFDHDVSDMIFSRRIASPNGEDYLYVFYSRLAGIYLLLSYNIIEQQVHTPIVCNGYSFFDNGELLYFKASEEPQKVHAIQIWQTPFRKEEDTSAVAEDKGAMLFKVGNREIVRLMADAREVSNLIQREDIYEDLYLELSRETTSILDSYFWLKEPAAFQIDQPIAAIKEAATGAIVEFEKVSRIRKDTESRTAAAREKVKKLSSSVHTQSYESIDPFVAHLSAMRGLRGEVISLKELRYANVAEIEALEATIVAETEKLSQGCVEFLLQEDSLAPYREAVEDQQSRIGTGETAAALSALEEEMEQSSSELQMLIDIVSNLKIEDTTHTTQIIDDISEIYAQLNQAKVALKNRRKSISSVEMTARFGAEMKLLSQSIVNFLDLSETVEQCDEYLTKLMVQLEELEGRFADFENFIADLTEKREEIYNAFESKKLALIESRNKRSNALMSTAERILSGIRNRVLKMKSVDEINGYLAADLMVEKIRDIIRELSDSDDTVKVDDLQSRLKSIREDAVRQLKDRQDLFVEGENIIKFGRHHFTVNTQALDLTILRRDGGLQTHLTGTNYFRNIEDPRILECRDIWDQEILSENDEVYRAEYLAYLFWNDGNADIPQEVEALEAALQKFMAPRYDEGYIKGVHDHDAARILLAIHSIHESIGLLRYRPAVRALAGYFWSTLDQDEARHQLARKAASFGKMRHTFHAEGKRPSDAGHYIRDLSRQLANFCQSCQLFNHDDVAPASEYLFEALTQDQPAFAISSRALDLVQEFKQSLKERAAEKEFQQALESVGDAPESKSQLAGDWIDGFLGFAADDDGQHPLARYADEAALLLAGILSDQAEKNITDPEQKLSGLKGSHERIHEGSYAFDYHDFFSRLSAFREKTVPAFTTYQKLKKTINEEERERLRLDEFKPRVLTSFVRNKLIDKVYLPLIGDNFAKQVGSAGEGKRTDLMGMLLLISPPGYGKTTLMEYTASRLGMIFMKINGPAIGHQVTSLDPGDAPNMSAREEVNKLNLALEMGDNVMIYLDDIQHCNPEFLQKFISLCDGQRKIEGVFNGRPRTYDLRGRKVAVVMAGNPYTESGEKFRIPDMLANRADTYNLGDIIGENADVFKLSYIENSITSNPALNHLASRGQKDIHGLIRIAETGSREGVDMEASYSMDEVNEMVGVVEKMLKIRDVILAVNQAYINSAAQADAYRTEPPFKLQGSYRNMNRLSEKVRAIMNDDELTQMIIDDYTNEAQTLTAGAEANLLKFRELMGWLTPEEAQRWDDIKASFQRNQLLHSTDGDDPVARVVGQLSALQAGLQAIAAGLKDGTEHSGLQQIQLTSETWDELKALVAGTHPSPMPQTISAVAPPAGEMESLASQDDIATAGDGAAGSYEPYKVDVVYRFPEDFSALLQEQMKIVQSLIEPTTKVARDERKELRKTLKDIQVVLGEYHHYLDELQGKAVIREEDAVATRAEKKTKKA